MADPVTPSPLTPLVAPTMQPYQSYLPTAFSDDLSLLQKVNYVINYLTTVTTTVNNAVTTINGYSTTIDQDVVNQLNTWLSDGTLGNLINTTLLDTINTHVDGFGYRLWDYVKGDGVTDDTSNIQKAIDDCVTNNVKRLWVGNQKHYVTSPIQTKGIELVGVGFPYIPFMTWDYASAYGTVNGYTNYLNLCMGPIFATDKNIAIFSDGLIAENIGLIGNRRASSYNMGVTSSDASQPFKTNNVIIQGFAGHGAYFPNGCYQFDIEKTQILQNGANGIYFDLNNGSGTGETNFVKISHSKIERNEKDGIAGKIKGRFISIKNTGLENNGEPSDSNRPKPTSSANVVYGINLELHNSGGMDNGAIVIEENYSESTYGLVRLNAIDPVYGISIKNNFWQPQDQTNYSNFVSVNGWIYGLEIKNNDQYTTHDAVLFETGNNIKNVEIDCNYTGVISQNTTPQKETLEDSDKVFLNFNSNGVKSVHNFGSGMATGFTYDSASNSTYINMTASKISGTVWNGYDMGADSGNTHVGQVVKVGGAFVGVVTAVSSANHLLTVRNDRSSFALGDGTVELVRVGGFETINGAGNSCKLVVDYDGTVLGIGS